MNGENVKKVYVVNLDNARLILITGVFISFCIISFFIGLRWNDNNNPPHITASSLAVPPETNSENLLTSGEAVKNAGVMALPEEDTKIFTKQGNVKKEDPFMADPPDHSDEKFKSIHKNAKKTVKKEAKKEEINHKVAAVSNEKFYTIQIATFAHDKDAQAYKSLLKKKGFEARIDQVKNHYYVRVGKSTEKDSLQAQLRKINRTMKVQAIVVQRKIT